MNERTHQFSPEQTKDYDQKINQPGTRDFPAPMSRPIRRYDVENNTIRRAPSKESIKANIPDTASEDKDSKLKKIAIRTAVGAAGVASFVALMSHINGGNDNPDRFDQRDASITRLHIDDGANVRFDPYVDNTNPNIATTVDSPEDITVEDGVYTHEDADGEWYGIPASEMPGLGTDQDNDGKVWINESTAHPQE